MSDQKKQKCITLPKKPRRITLHTKLQEIYKKTINLKTTCNGTCECCKVAMPQMNYSEFIVLWHKIQQTCSKSEKLRYITTSIEYFFRHRFEHFGKETLFKPCMFLKEEKCIFYSIRPLNCRLYGLWPEDEYNQRVDRFEKAYEGKLTREELPLNKQCPYVERIDDSVELTTEIINKLFAQLDQLDYKVGNFTEAQVRMKHNYRTFHDWVMLTVFKEEGLMSLSDFILKASKEATTDQIGQLKKAITETLAKKMPDFLKSVNQDPDGEEKENGNSGEEKG